MNEETKKDILEIYELATKYQKKREKYFARWVLMLAAIDGMQDFKKDEIVDVIYKPTGEILMTGSILYISFVRHGDPHIEKHHHSSQILDDNNLCRYVIRKLTKAGKPSKSQFYIVPENMLNIDVVIKKHNKTKK